MFVKINKKENQKAFTLIEVLVSIAIFSIVVVVSIGAIMTIFDANRKARSLMSVMNNLNFAVDSMTRSFQTGKNPSTRDCDNNDIKNCSCFLTSEIVLNSGANAINATEREVAYCVVDIDEKGKIIKYINNGSGFIPYDITSPDIDIDTLYPFSLVSGDNSQPILFMNIAGTVKASPKISSSFRVQTTVDQRDLEINI